jgi:hypothetical protein
MDLVGGRVSQEEVLAAYPLQEQVKHPFSILYKTLRRKGSN